jgi:hypothetical protein
LIVFNHNTGKAKVSADVISWLQDQSIQDLDLCRFLNSVLFLSKSNVEAKIITSSVSHPQIGHLKMPEADFSKKVYKQLF